MSCMFGFFFFSSRRRHTRCALVTGVQTCALPISWEADAPRLDARLAGLEVRSPRRIVLSRHANAPRADGWTPEHVRGDGVVWINGPTDIATLAGVDHVLVEGGAGAASAFRSEEHTSELQSLMRSSYAVFCLKKKQHTQY